MTFDSYTLGEVCSFIDYRGKTPKKATTGIPLITAKIVKNGFISKPDEFIAEEDYDSWMHRGIPRKGSVIMTTEAPLGEVARIPSDDRLAFAQRIIVLEPRQEILDAGFLYYALRDSVLMGRIKSRATGTTVTGIKAAELKKVEIDCPPIETQKRVASLLSSLDQRIENNESINDNLLQQAMAIFNERYDSAEERCPFTSLIHVLGGGTPKTGNPEFWNGDIPFFTPKDVGNPYTFQTEKMITSTGLEHCNSRLYPKNTSFVTARGTVGKVSLAGKPMAMNQSCYALSSDSIDPILVYFYTLRAVESLKHKASGAVFDAIVTRDFETEIVPVIPADESKAILALIAPMMEAIHTHSEESIRLAALRDALLPQLMSGEIDVSSITL